MEIQSFLSPSPVRDLQEAIGQYEIYRVILAETEPERLLFLAAPLRIYENLLSERFGQLIISRLQLRLLPRQESFASLHILTRRASEGSEALPSLARRVRMSFFGARVILIFDETQQKSLQWINESVTASS